MVQYNTRIRLKSDTTANWYANPKFIPLEGEVLIYYDYESTVDEDDNVLYIPAIKIGDGKTYGVDLPFVGDDIRAEIMAHISNDGIHVTAEDRLRWNNKLNVDDYQEVVEGALIFNRN